MNKSHLVQLEILLEDELEHLVVLESYMVEDGLLPYRKDNKYMKCGIEENRALRIIGSMLHDYYNIVENMIRHILTITEEGLPVGEDWHKKMLLISSKEVIGVRPPIISKELLPLLGELRSFRHVFRNIYGENLDAEKTVRCLKLIPKVSELLRRDISLFLGIMRASILL
jgi:hypothetical protein